MKVKELIAQNNIADALEAIKNSLIDLDQKLKNTFVSISQGFQDLNVNDRMNLLSREEKELSKSKIVNRLLKFIDSAVKEYINQTIFIVTTEDNNDRIAQYFDFLSTISFPLTVKIIPEFEANSLDIQQSAIVLFAVTQAQGKLSCPNDIFYDIKPWMGRTDKYFAFFPFGSVAYLSALPPEIRLIDRIEVKVPEDFKEFTRKVSVVLSDKPLPFDNFFHPLHEYPKGPMVEFHLISRSLKQTYANLIKANEARTMVSEIIKFRQEADSDDPDLTVVRHYDLPPPETVSTYTYWQDVFNEACLHGPRMLAAVLLVVPDFQFPQEVRAQRKALLAKLKNWEGE